MELLVVSNKQDITKSRIFAIVIMVIMVLLISLIHISSVTDPPVHAPITNEVPLEFMDLKLAADGREGGSPGGSGTPSDAQLNKTNPPQQTALVSTNDPNATAVQSGKSNKTNTDKPTNNTATTTTQSDNPFSKGGQGGGTEGGSGGLFGSDNGKGGKGTGSGSGTGSGNGKARVRHNNISTDNIYTNSEVKVVLILQVDEDGKVVGGRTVGAGTTTNDQQIISKVLSACKAQLRYAKGPSMTEEYYTAVIEPR
jgi:hypothetical protein